MWDGIRLKEISTEDLERSRLNMRNSMRIQAFKRSVLFWGRYAEQMIGIILLISFCYMIYFTACSSENTAGNIFQENKICAWGLSPAGD